MRWMFCLAIVMGSCGYTERCGTDGGLQQEGEGPINGTCAPEGQAYQDVYTCEGVVGPCGEGDSPGASAAVEEDLTRLDDPDYDWAKAQVDACSCVCCHTTDGVAAHVWSVDFEPVWTDSIPTDVLGRVLEGGRDNRLRPNDNNGFDREVSNIPSTDGGRLIEYLQREMDRRQ